ncbi:hypothetical protein [Kitasatospora sp. NPDC056181]|uniref:hypothetical protein n=1 Tax=Kitasatospora sp. NPDC056181 TaxID=3345737 RepID=UPI0035D80242
MHGSRGRWLRRIRAGGAVLVAALVMAVWGVPQGARAVPVRGNTGWSILMCKVSDNASEPHSAAWLKNFFTDSGAGTGGMDDYFKSISGGAVRIRNSNAAGWFTMPYTLAQEQGRDRWTRFNDCVNAASAGGYTVPAGHRTVVVTNVGIDWWGAGGAIYLDGTGLGSVSVAHEMLHGYGLGHSFSNDTGYRNAPWSAPGEYDDPWDEMSAANVYASGTGGTYGNTQPVGLVGFQLDKLGWVDHGRVAVAPAGWSSHTLSSFQSDDGSHPLLLRVPIGSDPFHYYTVEFTRKAGYAAGIPNDVVLIHEVVNGTPYLQRTLDGGARLPVTSLNANGDSIATSISGGTASVTVYSATSVAIYGPNTCVPGYVWRDGDFRDYTCVTPTTRSQAVADNAARYSRWVSGPYGPHTCTSGYVWREAWPGDDVCVTPAVRSQAAADNAAAPSRVLHP